MQNFDYYDPTSVVEAVGLLGQHTGKARVLAGGTDLFLRLRRRALIPEVLVDLKRIPELATLHYSTEDGLHIGATVTHGEVADHPAVQQHYGALVAAANWVGSPQTRHRGTVIGNVCNASPAADTAPALLAYRATVRIAGPDGQRDIPLEDFFQGPGRTALGPAELVTAIRIPAPRGPQGWGHGRRTRTVIDIALVSSCAVLQATNGVCDSVRVCLGAVGPVPMRAPRAEAVLQGQRPTATLVAEAGRVAAEEARPISDVRCSAAYRKDMVEVLTRRCVESALHMLHIL